MIQIRKVEHVHCSNIFCTSTKCVYRNMDNGYLYCSLICLRDDMDYRRPGQCNYCENDEVGTYYDKEYDFEYDHAPDCSKRAEEEYAE